jgi:hypothetical protein
MCWMMDISLQRFSSSAKGTTNWGSLWLSGVWQQARFAALLAVAGSTLHGIGRVLVQRQQHRGTCSLDAVV